MAPRPMSQCRAGRREGGAVGDVLWTPPADVREHVPDRRLPALAASATAGWTFADYDELWQWSVDRPGRVLAVDLGLLRGRRAHRRRPRRWPTRPCRARAGSPAPRSTTPSTCCGCRAWPTTTRWCSRYSQTRAPVTLTAAELREQVRRVAGRAAPARRRPGRPGRGLRAEHPRDVRAACWPRPAWARSSPRCAPEFGTRSVIDRWQQIEPKVLVAVDGYRYGDKAVDRRGRGGRDPGRAAVAARTPSLLSYLDPAAPPPTARCLGRAGGADRRAAGLRPGAVRPPAVRALLLRHHRAAQADRARPRRHPARAPQDAGPAPRPRARATGSSGSPPPAG